MSQSNPSGFGQFVPGFDFLKNLTQGATQSVPGMSNWVAPTLNTEEIDKRISELKAVHFWLDQNTKGLAATIQALEVQKLTLTALKGMNLNMSEIANAFKMPAAPAQAPVEPDPAPAPASAAPQAAPEPAAHAEPPEAAPEPAAAVGNGLLNSMQMWSALTQQFQHIAADALKEATKTPAAKRDKASAKQDGKTAKPATQKTAAKKTVKKPVAKKAPAKRSP